MKTAELAEIRRLFIEGCEIAPDERECFLESRCPEREDIRAAVLDLLREDSGLSRGFADRSEANSVDPGRVASESPALPEQLGPYRIRRVLGEGGMGIAYLAVQSNPDREVALKVLRFGASSLGARARFAREVRVLGRLVHPGIARIYEASHIQTAEGSLPYFTMEYVDGPRITEFVRTNTLDRAAILELVAKVADAVQHAHTRGVIHRDLKPANILIRNHEAADRADASPGTRTSAGGPRPAILDFGVARLLDGESERTSLTEVGQLIGTLAYMSPEQLSGDIDAIDARSDVYAIGVVLFELLTGELPFDLRDKRITEAVHIVQDQEPSTLAAACAPTGAKFDRDIETIVARALAKDRERRYATAAGLAEDLRRYLANEPILARPATMTYQLSKFARRHRGIVLGAVMAVGALVMGLGATSVMYVRAERERARADTREQQSVAMQEYLLEDLLKSGDPERMGPDASIADVVTGARDAIPARFAGQPEVEAQVHAKMAGVLKSLGKIKESAEEWARAVSLFEASLGPNDERTLDAMAMLAGSYINLQQPGKAQGVAEEVLRRAKDTLAEAHPPAVRALHCLGTISENQRHFGAAIKTYREVLSLLERNGDPDRITINLLLSIAHCEVARGRPEEAKQLLPDILARISAAAPVDRPLEGKVQLITIYKGMDDEPAALALADEVLPNLERDLTPQRRGLVYAKIARLYCDAGRFEDAERAGLRSFEILAQVHVRPTEQNGRAASMMRRLYQEWPGHEASGARWVVQNAAYVLMLRGPEGRKRLVRDMEVLASEYKAINADGDLLGALWVERDQLAPKGHPRRAAFFSNYASIEGEWKAGTHSAEALSEAAAARALDERAEPAPVEPSDPE